MKIELYFEESALTPEQRKELEKIVQLLELLYSDKVNVPDLKAICLPLIQSVKVTANFPETVTLHSHGDLMSMVQLVNPTLGAIKCSLT